MRVFGLSTLLLALVACAPGENEGLALRSVLQRATSGLVLHANGENGHAGMSGTNCPFDTASGRVTGDYDLPGEGERVVDHGPSPLGDETVLLVLERDLWMLEKSSGEYVVSGLGARGAVDARLIDAGAAVVLRAGDACAIGWRGWEAPIARRELPACPSAMAADPASGQVALVIDGALWMASAEAVAPWSLGREAGVVAWSADAQAFLVGSEAVELTAVSRDGATVWSADVGGPVQAVAATRGAARAVVHAGRPEGRGALAWLDVADGATVAAQRTPSMADAVTISDDASTVAVVVRDRSYFFSVSPDLR